MKTIQMTIDEQLLTKVDTAIATLGTTRSAFIRDALQAALKQLQIKAWEQQHIAGYQKLPMTQDEVAEWADIQSWGDEDETW
jgi:metal-responsive CopG/Arc/MetJ family transcriptional regulator